MPMRYGLVHSFGGDFFFSFFAIDFTVISTQSVSNHAMQRLQPKDTTHGICLHQTAINVMASFSLT